MWEALAVAEASEFVAAMHGGLHARIAQGGTNVSGGQRQRLAIAPGPSARGLLVRRLVLGPRPGDRCPAAARLVPRTFGATVLVVAQRVSTIASADQILVLEDGRPVGLGPHDELLVTCPTYAEIVASQLREDEAA